MTCARPIAMMLLMSVAACSNTGDGPEPMREDIAAGQRDQSIPESNPSSRALRGTVSELSGGISDLSTRVTDVGTIIDLPSDALFDYDAATLTDRAQDQLRKAAELIRNAPPGEIAIIGHTDSKGDEKYNVRLSEARARAVAAWLVQQPGVRQRSFTISGRGETDPVAPNSTEFGADDPAGRAKNRRVEVIVPNVSPVSEMVD